MTMRSATGYQLERAELERERLRRYRAEHPEKTKASRDKWRLANAERQKSAQKAWRAAHPDAVKAIQKRNDAKRAEKRRLYAKQRRQAKPGLIQQWRLANPEKARLQVQRRRARRAGAGGYHTLEQVRARVAMWGGRCAYCAGPYEHIDHVIPLARGGTNWPANLRPACAPCNSTKNRKDWRRWV